MRKVIILLSMAILAGCSEKQPIQDWSQDLEEQMNFEVAEDVTIWYTDSAMLKAKIKGDTLRRFIDRIKPFDEFEGNVKVDFFDSEGHEDSRMVADYAIRYEKDGIVVARDREGVILSNNEGDTLISTEVIWNEKLDKIYTDRFVKIITPDRIIWGQGFESNNDFSKGRIKSVEGQLDAEKMEVQ
jgi:LPS export ABC transporter protein LptC